MPYKDSVKSIEYQKQYRRINKTILNKKHDIYRKKHWRAFLDNMNIAGRKFKVQWKIIIANLGADRCSICGYQKCFAAIEYHHPDPSTKKNGKDNPSGLLKKKPTDKRINLFKTFTPLCANCHREIHWLRQGE